MMLKQGEKVFIIARRIFEKDLRRHFAGEVLESTDTAVRVRGYAFVYDDNSQEFVRRDEIRTRLFSLTDAGYIINLMPSEVILEEIRYQIDERNQRIITDGKAFQLNVSEFSARR
jgi:hypothetical protein